MKNKLRSYKELNHLTKGWIFARLKYNETIPEIAKHFNCSVITINRVIEERLNINKRMLKTKKMDKLDELIHRIKQHQPLLIIIFIYLLAIILLI